MKFSISVWLFRITLYLVDIDPTDGNIRIGIELSW